MTKFLSRLCAATPGDLFWIWPQPIRFEALRYLAQRDPITGSWN